MNINSRPIVSAVILIVALIIIVGGVSWYKGSRESAGPVPEFSDQSNIMFQEIPIEFVSPEARVPVGFPEDVPLERDSIVQSYIAQYLEAATVQYTVAYATDMAKSEKYEEYLSYMTRAGYEFTENGRNPESGTLYGRKNGDDLSIIIGEQESKTRVHIDFLDRLGE